MTTTGQPVSATDIQLAEPSRVRYDRRGNWSLAPASEQPRAELGDEQRVKAQEWGGIDAPKEARE